MLNLDYQTAMNQGGATGLSYAQTGDRTVGDTRSPISRDGSRTIAGDRTIASRDALTTRTIDGRTIAAERSLPNQRPPLVRDESARTFYNDPIPRTIAGLRDRIQRTDNGRMIATASSSPETNNAGEIPANNQNKTPLDFKLEDLFRGFYGEGIRGRGETGGEFLYVPAASNSGGSNSGMLILLVAGAGIIGYFAYKKFSGG